MLSILSIRACEPHVYKLLLRVSVALGSAQPWQEFEQNHKARVGVRLMNMTDPLSARGVEWRRGVGTRLNDGQLRMVARRSTAALSQKSKTQTNACCPPPQAT